jgi:hypothetical protein
MKTLYELQGAGSFPITAGLQVIFKPAFNGGRDVIAGLSLRVRWRSEPSGSHSDRDKPPVIQELFHRFRA